MIGQKKGRRNAHISDSNYHKGITLSEPTHVSIHMYTHRYVHSGVPTFTSTDSNTVYTHTHTFIRQTCPTHFDRCHSGSSLALQEDHWAGNLVLPLKGWVTLGRLLTPLGLNGLIFKNRQNSGFLAFFSYEFMTMSPGP